MESTASSLNNSLTGTLVSLAPTEMASVYEVLRRAGFDVSAWAVSATGRAITNPAVNGRAYEWSFKDDGGAPDVFMLWYADMEVENGSIRYRRPWGGMIADLERTRPVTAHRAERFLRHVSNLKLGTAVRVGIVEGTQADVDDIYSSQVTQRTLDQEPWHLSFWDPYTSTFEFTRGPHSSSATEIRMAAAGEIAGAASTKTIETAATVNDILSPETSQSALQGRIEDDIRDIQAMGISSTEKDRLITARLGQGGSGRTCCSVGAVRAQSQDRRRCKHCGHLMRNHGARRVRQSVSILLTDSRSWRLSTPCLIED